MPVGPIRVFILFIYIHVRTYIYLICLQAFLISEIPELPVSAHSEKLDDNIHA